MKSRIAVVFVVVLLGRIGFAGDWQGHDQNIMAIKNHIDQAQSQIEKTIALKNAATDAKEKHALMALLVELHKELEVEKQKLANELKHVNYRHPERGEEFKKDYHVNSETESRADVYSDELARALDVTKKTMVLQYGDYGKPRMPSNAIQHHYLIPEKKGSSERITLRK